MMVLLKGNFLSQLGIDLSLGSLIGVRIQPAVVSEAILLEGA